MLVDNILMFAAGWYRRKLFAAIGAAASLAVRMALILSIVFKDRPFQWDTPGLWVIVAQVTFETAIHCTVFYIFGYTGRAVRDRAKGRIAPHPK